MSNDVNINIGDIVNIKNIKTSNTFDTTNYVVMIIKKNNPKRRKAFRARHRCDNPGPRHKARYWACKTW